MKKLVYSLIASLCLVGCSEDWNEIPQNSLAQQGSVKTLTATVGETQSRTSLGNGGAVLWSAADAIALTDGTTWAEYTLAEGAGKAFATFQATEEAVPDAETYYAYYPAEHVTAVSGNEFTVTLPATQTYTTGSFAPDALPMMAVSTSTDFDFKHVCGLLKLTLTNGGNDALSISKIIVSADQAMSGTATVTCADGDVATLTEGGGVTVTFAQPLALATGASEVVYVALPVQEYTNAKISVITADDKYSTFNAGSEGFAIERAKFSNVELSLSPAEIAQSALPEMVASEFTTDLQTAVSAAIGSNDLSGVQHIVFKPNSVTGRASAEYTIVYDEATGTATIQFAAPMAKLTNAHCMFSNMRALVSVDLSSLDTSEVTDMSWMFWYCSSLESLDLSSFDTGKVTDMSNMFFSCSALTSLDLSSFDTSKVTSMSAMFYECSSLTSLDLSSFDTSKVTDMSHMFNFCQSLTSVNLSSFDTSKVTSMEVMFGACSSLASLDLSSFDTSKVTNMSYMFSASSSLTSLDLSNFDTSNVKNMKNMFSECSGLTSLDLSSFDTSKVTDMSYMFDSCPLASLDLSNFDTSNVTKMSGMFYGSLLASLDLSHFDTGNVTNMSYMFRECSALTSLDLSNFDTSKVTTISSMFKGCSALKSLDLNSFSTNALTNYSDAFANVPTDCEITISSALKEKVSGQLSSHTNVTEQ